MYKKVLMNVLGLSIAILISGCGKLISEKIEWTIFVQPAIGIGNETFENKGTFLKYKGCEEYANELYLKKEYGNSGFHYYCGLNCKYIKDYDQYICKDEIEKKYLGNMEKLK